MEECKEINSGVSTYIRNLDDLTGQTITIDDEFQYSVKYCGDMALYYLNSRGGWDCFLIEGAVKKKDTFTNSQLDKSFNNNSIEFGTERYLSEITTSYELHTGWLTDSQSKILCEELLGSNQVFAHNLIEDKIFPVVITDTSADYKTHKSEGKLVSYTINIQESQTKIRK